MKMKPPKKKSKKKPSKTWEDTPQFCADDFSLSREEKEIIDWWREILQQPKGD